MAKIKSARPKNIIGSVIDPIGNGDGRFGRAIQEEYDKAGIRTNRGSGPDLPQYNTEIKSRKKNTWAPATIGTAPIKQIIATNGEVFLTKLDQWDLHVLDDEPLELIETVVCKIEILDWKPIHSFLKDELKDLANQLANNPPLTNWVLAQTQFFRIERVKEFDDKSGKLRVNGNKWNNILAMLKSAQQYNNLFEEI
jgi:hypothetical protein